MSTAKYRKIDLYTRAVDGGFIYFLSTAHSATCKAAVARANHVFPGREFKASFAKGK